MYCIGKIYISEPAISEGPLNSTNETDGKNDVICTTLFNQEAKDSEPDISLKHQISSTSSSSVVAASTASTSSSESSRLV